MSAQHSHWSSEHAGTEEGLASAAHVSLDESLDNHGVPVQFADGNMPQNSPGLPMPQ